MVKKKEEPKRKDFDELIALAIEGSKKFKSQTVGKSRDWIRREVVPQLIVLEFLRDELGLIRQELAEIRKKLK